MFGSTSYLNFYMSMQNGMWTWTCWSQIFEWHLWVKVVLPIFIYAQGSHMFAMFFAHALREGCGHAHIWTWRPLPNLLKYALCMALGMPLGIASYTILLSGQFFFVSAMRLVTSPVALRLLHNYEVTYVVIMRKFRAFTEHFWDLKIHRIMD